jgi:ribosomal protein S18 acetylase RimI-like enzyme
VTFNLAKITQSLRSVLGRIFNCFFRKDKFVLVERILAETSFQTETNVKVGLRIIQRDDFSKIFDKFKKSRVDIEKVSEDASLCAVAEIDGNLVHWTFVAFDKAYVRELERKICVAPGTVYLYAIHTDPDYRGLGIASKVMTKILGYLQEEGFEKAYALIRPNNSPSLRYTQKLGFKKIGTIDFSKIFGLKIYRCKSKIRKNQDKLMKMFSAATPKEKLVVFC